MEDNKESEEEKGEKEVGVEDKKESEEEEGEEEHMRRKGSRYTWGGIEKGR